MCLYNELLCLDLSLHIAHVNPKGATSNGFKGCLRNVADLKKEEKLLFSEAVGSSGLTISRTCAL